ncbi:unnamed protein product [Brassica rapa subsp. trilocularis]
MNQVVFFSLFVSVLVQVLVKTFPQKISLVAGDLLSCSYTVLDKTNSIDGTVPEQVKFQSEVKKLQQEQFRPAEQVSISSQEMLQYIALE